MKGFRLKIDRKSGKTEFVVPIHVVDRGINFENNHLIALVVDKSKYGYRFDTITPSQLAGMVEEDIPQDLEIKIALVRKVWNE